MPTVSTATTSAASAHHRRGGPASTNCRVFVAFDMLWQLGRLASLVLGGLLADAAGIVAVHIAGAVLLTAAAVIGWNGLRTNQGPKTPRTRRT
jgi:hypothetical protein